MNRVEWEKETFDSVVVKFSDFLAELWKTHPFREGNTRTIVTFCCLFIEAQGIYIESELFKDNAAYVRNALVAASAIFHDMGGLRKPEYLYRIVEDALYQGRVMKEDVSEKIVSAGFSPTEKNINEIVLWNRRTHTEHTSEEIMNFLDGAV